MDSRFERAKSYLIDLLRAYGHRPIIVMIRRDGEEVEVMAKTFVKRQLTSVDIMFPYNEANKWCTKIINNGLDHEELSIIFHEALFEFEEAYVEEFCMGKPEAAPYIESIFNWIEQKREWLQCTFSYFEGDKLVPFLEEEPKPKLNKGDLSIGLDIVEDDLKILKEMGYNQISSVHAMTRLFWDFATHRMLMGKLMKNAILSITVDEEAADYLNSYGRFYNRFLQAEIEKKIFPNYESDLKKLSKRHEYELEVLNKKHQAELMNLSSKHKKDVAERNRKHQEELQGKIHKYKVKLNEYAAIVKKLRQLVLNPNSKISQTYDLTDEKDIRDFISWFRVIHRKIRNQTVKYFLSTRFADNPDDAALFKKMVEEYNSSLLAEREVEEEAEEEIEDSMNSE